MNLHSAIPVLTVMNFHHGLPGHESLDVTLAYLKGKDAESAEAQEHANSSSWRCMHKRQFK
jgi:hypothetical protein